MRHRMDNDASTSHLVATERRSNRTVANEVRELRKSHTMANDNARSHTRAGRHRASLSMTNEQY